MVTCNYNVPFVIFLDLLQKQCKQAAIAQRVLVWIQGHQQVIAEFEGEMVGLLDT